jgi:hypothetical protein
MARIAKVPQTTQTLEQKIDSLEQLLAAEVFAEDAFRATQARRADLAQELSAATEAEKQASKHRKQTADAVTKTKMKLPVPPSGVRYPTYESVEQKVRAGEFVVRTTVAEGTESETETETEPTVESSVQASVDGVAASETTTGDESLNADEDEGLSNISALPKIDSDNLFATTPAPTTRASAHRGQLSAVR